MDLIFKTEIKGNYLYAYYEGERDTAKKSNIIWSEISKQLNENNLNKALVVENITHNAGTILELYQLANLCFKLGFGGKTIAFVDLIEEHQKSNSFGETVARNLGINVKIFKTVSEAEDWMLNSNNN